jgi:exosortase A-associated hydrolase 2
MEAPISFFLPGAAGNLFAMYYPPAQTEIDAGDVLYVHPFAGEMFASRNLIAEAARSLARSGLGVLSIDLYGCGDSAGDFSEARWEIWRDDLAAAVGWLQSQGRDRLSLWGLRLGALLAMDFAFRSREHYEKIVLWQPVVAGKNMLTQFFHMNLDEADSVRFSGKLTDPEARKALPGGDNIEIAGYQLSGELVRAIDQVEMMPLGQPHSGPIHWAEFGERVENPLQADSQRVITEWRKRRVEVTAHKIAAAPFWLFPHCTDPGHLIGEVHAMFEVTDQMRP